MITTGKIEKPNKDLIYGVEGVGKTSLAATYPKPLFIDFEGSTNKMDVDRIVVENWDTFVKAIKYIIKEGDTYQTIVFDSIDWLERLAISQMLISDGCKSLSDGKYSYGRGDNRVEEFFNTNIMEPIKILNRKRNIVLIAHCYVKGFEDPINGRYDTYQLKMNKKPASLIKEWSNNTFFLNYDVKVFRESEFEKKRASTTNKIHIHTKKSPAFEAKRRDELHDILVFKKGINPYSEFIWEPEAEKEGEAA